MLINFHSPVYPLDEYSQKAFVEILNLVVLAENIEDLSDKLCQRDRHPWHGMLYGYFKWSYTNDSFRLRQRSGFWMEECFEGITLEVKLYSLARGNRKNVRN